MIFLPVFIPLAAALFCLMIHRGVRAVPVLSGLLSAGVGLQVLLTGTVYRADLVGSFSVGVLLDKNAAWFVLLNAVVTLAAALHERSRGRPPYFFVLLALLHGSLNACFISADLLNLFVVIELATIIAFLLVSQGLKTRHLWNGLRYLFLSNVGMLFFLLGTLLVYEASGSFALAGVGEAPPTARALIVAGLLVKGGVFFPGLWLPQAHAEAEAVVSALLSGVVIKIGLLPLIRLEAYIQDLDLIIRCLGFGGVFLGLFLGFFQRDIKRLLACSTISQAGFILISPEAGCAYAFTHGVAKAALFLGSGSLPSRDLRQLRAARVDRRTLVPMQAAALSIAGCPLLMGFSAKYMVSAELPARMGLLAAAASVGTAALLSPILLLRCAPAAAEPAWRPAPLGLCAVLLAGGILFGPWGAAGMLKAAAVIGAGLLLSAAGLRKLADRPLPDGWEKLEHVVGMTCLVLILITLAVYIP